jgi:NAD(P)-dependent dehydrogenase (short-subunit alcohol dehydrogenase family)
MGWVRMPEGSMAGKVCVITGAASGMGRIAARELAKAGATVVMNDREIDEGEAAREDIVKLSGNEKVEFVGCDMLDLEQVRAFAAHVLNSYDRVDVLINNAGLTDPEFQESKEGVEQHMAIMHVSHYLLTELLLERMKSSAPARILQITSEAHKAGPGIDFDDMRCDKVWKGKRYANTGAFKAYHRAKLAMVYATYELAEKLAGTGVTVNAISPGYFVGTNVFRHMRGFMKFGVKLVHRWFPDPERAAKTYVYLASSPEVEGVSGKYWEYCEEKETSSLSHDKVLRQRLIEFTEKVLRVA